MENVYQPNQNTQYRPEIDGLRAIAVISVVLYHAFPTTLQGGFIGVDIFFVISGFLISTNIIEELNKNKFRFSNFLIRRICRLFPALLLVMLSTMLIGWFVLFADEFVLLSKHVGTGALFVSNFAFADESGYFDTASEMKPMLHLWSLSVEEQFYLIWPVIILLFWRKKYLLILATTVLLVGSLNLNLRFVESHPAHVFFWPISRFWELLTGSLLGFLTFYKRYPSMDTQKQISKTIPITGENTENKSLYRVWLNLVSLGGMLMLASGVSTLNSKMQYPSVWTFFPVLGACAIIASGSTPIINRYILANPILVWFGLISYPLYLWHWPLLSFYHITYNPDPEFLRPTAIIVFSIVLSWLTYKFVERPIRYTNANRQTAFKLLGLMILTFLFSAFVYFSNGQPGRFNNSFERIEDGYSNKCGNLEKSDACQLGNKASHKKILMYGDSHAFQLTSALEQALGEEYHIYAVTLNSCFMGPEIKQWTANKRRDEICARKMEFLSALGKQQHFDLVITAQRWHGYGQRTEEQFKLALLDRLKNFNITADKFVIVAATTDVNFACEKNNERPFSASKLCELSGFSSDTPKYVAEFRRAAGVVADNAFLIYPNLSICGADVCNIKQDGEIIYSDNHHLSKFGSEIIVQEVNNILLEQNKLK